MPQNFEYQKGVKHSKMAPAFEVTKANPYGLKHMLPDEEEPNLRKVVKMETKEIAVDLSDPTPPLTRHAKAWKPKGRV